MSTLTTSDTNGWAMSVKHCFDGVWHPANGFISNRIKD